MTLGVEEVGRLQMRCEVLVLDVDAVDLGPALEGRLGLVDDELRLDLPELALERADEVGNSKPTDE